MSSEPVQNYPQVNASAQVNAVINAPDGSQYIGGTFKSVDSNPAPIYMAANGTTVNVSTSIPSTSMPAPDEYVGASVSDGAGGWYIGGEFENVGNVPCRYVAHILADGTVDTSFNLDINGGVTSLIFDDTTDTLYVGGYFTEVNGGTARNGLAAFDVNTGTTTSFDPNLEDLASSYSGTVDDMVLSSDGQTLYVVGYFDTVNGITSRNKAAALDTSTGVATSFDAELEVAWNTYARTVMLTPDDSTVYIGGTFTNVNGTTPRTNIAGFDTSTGVATAFDAGLTDGYSQYVTSIAFDDTTDVLYVGGYFTEVNGGTARNGVAAFDVNTSTATSFDPNIQAVNTNVVPMATIVALTADKQTLYVGGYFDTVNTNTQRTKFAAFDTSTSVATSFDPAPDVAPATMTFSQDEQTLYIGGEFAYFGGQPTTTVLRNGVARILPDGTVDPDFDLELDEGTTISALALSPDGTKLYVGGTFVYVNGGSAERWGFAAFDTSTGVVTSLNPELSGDGWSPAGIENIVVSSDGAAIYVTGYFNTINGVITRNSIAAFSATTGIVGSFDPQLDMYESARTMVLSSDDQTIYVGGEFATVNGGATPRNNLAAFDTLTGTATPFNPNVNNSVYTLELSKDDSVLYLGGNFTNINGTTRRRLASVSTNTGVPTSFNPNVTGDAVYALALTPDESTLYAGGGYTRVNGTGNSGSIVRGKLTGFNTTTGAVNNFSIATPGGSVYPTVYALAMTPNGSALYAGGGFLLLGANAVRNNLVAFADPSIPPSPGPGPNPDDGGGSSESSSDDLANTGMSTQLVLLMAMVLIAAGSTGLYIANRKKGSPTV